MNRPLDANGLRTLPTPPGTGLRHTVEAAVTRARQTGDTQYLQVVIGTGTESPLGWIARQSAIPSFYWSGRSDPLTFAGAGIAAVAQAQGPGSMAAVMDEGMRILRRCVSVDETGSALPPRMFGGFSFDSARPSEGPWENYPSAYLVLPRLLCAQADRRSRCLVTAVVAPGVGPEDVLREIELAQSEAAPVGGPSPSPDSTFLTNSDLIELEDPEWWSGCVAALTSRMNADDLQKVVLARRFALPLAGKPDAWQIVERLRSAEGGEGCFVFGFRLSASAAFVGASPERLFRLTGRTIETECLAGTIGRGSDPDADQSLAELLLASRKDNLEHFYVLDDILQALGELCGRMDAGTRPQVLKLPTLQHLITTARGELRADQTVSDVLARLHPTPAVGGTPRDRALASIREMEPQTRGWYAGPVGWFGMEEAEFAVAIRSAMLTPSGATIYAGAGIVPGSEAEKEWRETENKARAFVRALGSGRR